MTRTSDFFTGVFREPGKVRLTCADRRRYAPSMTCSPVLAEICMEAVRRNLTAVRRRLAPGTPLCAAVKADAYGHGIAQVLPVLTEAGVQRLAVANLDEAIELRRLGWSRPVLMLGPVLSIVNQRERTERAMDAVAAGVSCTVSSIHEVRILATAAAKLGRSAHVDIQVDSGMGRLGLLWEQAEDLIADISRCRGVVIDGVYTHFATADEPDLSYARQQMLRFSYLVGRLQARRVAVGAFHAANSAAVFRLPESHLDLVRPGLAVYGYWGGPPDERPADLWPAMRVVSRLTAVRRLPAGHAIGYGCTFTTRRESLIGTVPIGYADGYRRFFSNDAVVTVPVAGGRSRRTAPIVGRISMDQATVDLTGLGDVTVGDEVVIIDDDPQSPNSVESLARRLGTIPYEVTCLLGQRIHRMSVRELTACPALSTTSCASPAA